jgi:hypothetical protein
MTITTGRTSPAIMLARYRSPLANCATAVMMPMACRARPATQAHDLVVQNPYARTAIVMLAVIANLDEDPFMARTFRSEIVYPWRTSAAAALERGVGRGDLPPDADIPFLLDVIVGTVFQRAVINAQSETDGLDDAILDLVLAR